MNISVSFSTIFLELRGLSDSSIFESSSPFFSSLINIVALIHTSGVLNAGTHSHTQPAYHQKRTMASKAIPEKQLLKQIVFRCFNSIVCGNLHFFHTLLLYFITLSATTTSTDKAAIIAGSNCLKLLTLAILFLLGSTYITSFVFR